MTTWSQKCGEALFALLVWLQNYRNVFLLHNVQIIKNMKSWWLHFLSLHPTIIPSIRSKLFMPPWCGSRAANFRPNSSGTTQDQAEEHSDLAHRGLWPPSRSSASVLLHSAAVFSAKLTLAKEPSQSQELESPLLEKLCSLVFCLFL